MCWRLLSAEWTFVERWAGGCWLGEGGDLDVTSGLGLQEWRYG